jgi:hypothetical protein
MKYSVESKWQTAKRDSRSWNFAIFDPSNQLKLTCQLLYSTAYQQCIEAEYKWTTQRMLLHLCWKTVPPTANNPLHMSVKFTQNLHPKMLPYEAVKRWVLGAVKFSQSRVIRWSAVFYRFTVPSCVIYKCSPSIKYAPALLFRSPTSVQWMRGLP